MESLVSLRGGMWLLNSRREVLENALLYHSEDRFWSRYHLVPSLFQMLRDNWLIVSGYCRQLDLLSLVVCHALLRIHSHGLTSTLLYILLTHGIEIALPEQDETKPSGGFK
jgi:hypothetical protein